MKTLRFDYPSNTVATVPVYYTNRWADERDGDIRHPCMKNVNLVKKRVCLQPYNLKRVEEEAKVKT